MKWLENCLAQDTARRLDSPTMNKYINPSSSETAHVSPGPGAPVATNPRGGNVANRRTRESVCGGRGTHAQGVGRQDAGDID